MRDIKAPTKAALKYVTAYEAHYRAKDLRTALELYRVLIESYPDTIEAVYARSQVRNIAAQVVPQQELLATQLQMAMTFLPPDGEANP